MALLQSLDRLTRLEVFQEFIRGLEEVERQEREKEKELRRRQERRNRDAFRQLLQQHRCGLLFSVVVCRVKLSKANGCCGASAFVRRIDNTHVVNAAAVLA